MTSPPAIYASGRRLCLKIVMDVRIAKILENRDAEVNSIGRSDAQVLQADGCFLKIALRGKLERAAALQEYFHAKGLAARLVAFDQDEQRDYLLVEAVKGRSGIEILENPEWLVQKLGKAVRALHELDAADCPVRDVNEQAVALYERETGHGFDGDLSLLKADALVHGDCCLPNVFFSEAGFSGFIDLGEGGLGDRHFDLYWAMWSLGYNLKTDAYSGRFLDAYGRDWVDEARLDVCARLSRCDD